MAETTLSSTTEQSPSRFLFAGPQADTADGTLLDQAKRMEKKRTPQAMIFQTTGWFRGADGQWRYEISDHDAKLKIGIPKEVEEDVIARVAREVKYEVDGKIVKAVYRPDAPENLKASGFTEQDARENMIRNLIKREYSGFRSLEQLKGQYAKLEDVLDHPRLYAAYPSLARLTVHFSTQMNGTTKGEYSRGEGIVLNANRAESDILSTLLHEIQHAIQAGEGFAIGGAPDPRWTGAIKSTLAVMDDDYQRRIDRWLDRHDDLVDEHHTASDMLTYGLMYESVQRLRSHANRDRPSGVLRLIKQEMGWVYHDKVREDPELRRRFDELERNWYNLPKRHKMQARNAFLREQAWNASEMIQEVIPPDVYREFRQDDRQTRSIIKALERAASKAHKALEPLRELEQEKRAADALKEKYQYSSAFEVYRALAGEVEARNTQARQQLTPEERRRTQPEMTADVKRDQAIVMFEETGYQHIVTPHRVSDAAPDYLYTPPGEGRPLTRETASYIANSLMHGWAGRPNIDVVNRVSELPRKLQKDIHDARAYQDVRAAFWNDTAYLIAPRLPSREALEEVLLHEVVGHYGLRKMLSDDLAPTLETVYQNFGDTDLAQRLKGTYFQGTAFDQGNPEHRQLVAEEMMAHLAESNDHQSLDLWDRFDSQTRAGLRQMGYQLPMSSTDLLYILHGAQRVVQTGGISQPSEFDRRFRLAYHGSPHVFDRFSLAAVGSGEGQQAYGYGLYFAGHRSVAEFYRATVQNDIYVPDVAEELGIDLPSPRPPVTAAIKRMSWESRLSSDDAAKRVQWQVRAAREMDRNDIAQLIEEIRSRQNGNLYEVSIPDDDQLLNRDAPLSKQSETVKAILRKIDFPLTSTDAYAYQASFGVEPFAPGVINEPTGADLQAAIARAADQQTFDRQGPIWDLVKDDPNRLNYSLSQITSIYLNSLGIPGLRYRDAFSRTDDAEGTSNYVIWDDDVVTIEAINEEVRQANEEARFKLAYHGSPHKFDRFSLDAVGTGEGAQAYGWGLYFADSERVARWYRDSLADDMGEPAFYVDGEPVDPGDDIHLRTALYQASSLGPEAAYQDMIKWAGQIQASGEKLLPDTIRTMEIMQDLQGREVSNRNGQLYQVSLPEDDDLLDWDAPLDQQPEKVQLALRRLPGESYRKITEKDMGGNPPTGSLMYNRLQEYFAAGRRNDVFSNAANYGAKEASLELNDVGIPGLRFLDGVSRKKGEGTRNYVIWDPNVVSIEAVNEEIRQAEQAEAVRFSRAHGPDQGASSLRLYHATTKAFDQFSSTSDIGYHLGTAETAVSRLEDLVELYDQPQDAGRVIAADVMIENPLRMNDAGRWESEGIAYELELAGLIQESEIDTYAAMSHGEIRQFLQSKGYDGIVYENEMEGGGDSYIAFDADQIKIVGVQSASPGAQYSGELQTATEAFKTWFSDSQVVDGNGKPQVVYHGTMGEIDQFRRGEGGTFGAGIYFTKSPAEASFWAGDREADGIESEFGGSVVPAYVSITNPAGEDVASDYEARYGSEAWREMEKDGYDGVIAGNEVVAFHPEQIKSATGNTGAFDPRNPDIRFSRENVVYFPTRDQPDYEAGMFLLGRLDDEELAGLLNEECGIDASDMSRENQILEAHGHGLHRILNQHYTDLIDIALDRFDKGVDTATEAAKTIAFQIEKQGAYGYDLQKIQPVLAQAAGNGNVQPGKTGPAQPTQSAEDRFRSFLYQELGFQEECLLMAELAPEGDEVSIRRRQEHHRKEVDDLREHLSMLDAGMSVAEIRQATQRPKAPAQSPAQVTHLQDHLAMARAHRGCMGEPDEQPNPGPAPG